MNAENGTTKAKSGKNRETRVCNIFVYDTLSNIFYFYVLFNNAKNNKMMICPVMGT